ncbi:MAG: AAA family ATPase [Deltaproteobacteria bacterium]|nr:AAA family ATPase [Deltaproteobacteria bacterium]
MLRADGGSIVFNLLDAITEPGVWKALKRTIKTNEVVIEAYDSYLFFVASAMKPQGISVDVKFIVVGETQLYHTLYYWDEDFRKLFKVRADFDTAMNRTNDGIKKTARYISQIVRDEKLLHFDRTGVAALVEESVAMAGRQEKLTARFSILSDVIRESSYCAKKGRKNLVSARHVQQALNARKYRHNLVEERIQEMIDRDTILIDTTGDAAGQVNGLAVYQVGSYAFGRPTRITVKVGQGARGHREYRTRSQAFGQNVRQGDAYPRGIFTRPLRRRQADHPDRVGRVRAELRRRRRRFGVQHGKPTHFFSAIAGMPIRQGIAVTGSINQNGDIQAIGGVNEKVEGFYRVCKAKRRRGVQGVIIPASNAKDLMLPADIVEDVRKGKFHIWSITHVDQGLEILMGKTAGTRGKDRKFPKGSINEIVDRKLLTLAKELQDFGKDKKDDAKKSQGGAKKSAAKKK